MNPLSALGLDGAASAERASAPPRGDGAGQLPNGSTPGGPFAGDRIGAEPQGGGDRLAQALDRQAADGAQPGAPGPFGAGGGNAGATAGALLGGNTPPASPLADRQTAAPGFMPNANPGFRGAFNPDGPGQGGNAAGNAQGGNAQGNGWGGGNADRGNAQPGRGAFGTAPAGQGPQATQPFNLGNVVGDVFNGVGNVVYGVVNSIVKPIVQDVFKGFAPPAQTTPSPAPTRGGTGAPAPATTPPAATPPAATPPAATPPAKTPPPATAPPAATPPATAPGNAAPGGTTPGTGTPGKPAPPGAAAPGKGAPGNAAPGQGNAPPGKGTPGNGAPGNATPGNGAPGNAIPGKAAPGNGTPGINTPGNVAPGNGGQPFGEGGAQNGVGAPTGRGATGGLPVGADGGATAGQQLGSPSLGRAAGGDGAGGQAPGGAPNAQNGGAQNDGAQNGGAQSAGTQNAGAVNGGGNNRFGTGQPQSGFAAPTSIVNGAQDIGQPQVANRPLPAELAQQTPAEVPPTQVAQEGGATPGAAQMRGAVQPPVQNGTNPGNPLTTPIDPGPTSQPGLLDGVLGAVDRTVAPVVRGLDQALTGENGASSPQNNTSQNTGGQPARASGNAAQTDGSPIDAAQNGETPTGAAENAGEPSPQGGAPSRVDRGMQQAPGTPVNGAQPSLGSNLGVNTNQNGGLVAALLGTVGAVVDPVVKALGETLDGGAEHDAPVPSGGSNGGRANAGGLPTAPEAGAEGGLAGGAGAARSSGPISQPIPGLLGEVQGGLDEAVAGLQNLIAQRLQGSAPGQASPIESGGSGPPTIVPPPGTIAEGSAAEATLAASIGSTEAALEAAILEARTVAANGVDGSAAAASEAEAPASSVGNAEQIGVEASLNEGTAGQIGASTVAPGATCEAGIPANPLVEGESAVLPSDAELSRAETALGLATTGAPGSASVAEEVVLARASAGAASLAAEESAVSAAAQAAGQTASRSALELAAARDAAALRTGAVAPGRPTAASGVPLESLEASGAAGSARSAPLSTAVRAAIDAEITVTNRITDPGSKDAVPLRRAASADDAQPTIAPGLVTVPLQFGALDRAERMRAAAADFGKIEVDPDLVLRYAEAIRAERPWTWRELAGRYVMPRERAAIRDAAFEGDWLPAITIDPDNGAADFASSGLARHVDELGELTRSFESDAAEHADLESRVAADRLGAGLVWHRADDAGTMHLVPATFHHAVRHCAARVAVRSGPSVGFADTSASVRSRPSVGFADTSASCASQAEPA